MKPSTFRTERGGGKLQCISWEVVNRCWSHPIDINSPDTATRFRNPKHTQCICIAFLALHVRRIFFCCFALPFGVEIWHPLPKGRKSIFLPFWRCMSCLALNVAFLALHVEAFWRCMCFLAVHVLFGVKPRHPWRLLSGLREQSRGAASICSL